jgi:hypothetical protein
MKVFASRFFRILIGLGEGNFSRFRMSIRIILFFLSFFIVGFPGAYSQDTTQKVFHAGSIVYLTTQTIRHPDFCGWFSFRLRQEIQCSQFASIESARSHGRVHAPFLPFLHVPQSLQHGYRFVSCPPWDRGQLILR